MFRLQIVILVVLALGIGAALFGGLAAKETMWVTVHADKKLDDRVALDEALWVYLVERGDSTIALAYHGPWHNEPVVYCPRSQMFETPRSGSKFDLYGHYVGGPAPRGMSRYLVRMRDGDVQIQPKELIAGPPRGRPVRQPVAAFCIPY
jgi:cytochrome b6-f complex iron-sulfur subunit